MPVVNGRLTCCMCGADLGSAEDPYRDPDCIECLHRQLAADLQAEQEEPDDYPETATCPYHGIRYDPRSICPVCVEEEREQGVATREEQRARYLDCGPGAWDDLGESPDY